MNKTVNFQPAGIVILQNVGRTSKSRWYLVKPDFLRQVSEIIEEPFLEGRRGTEVDKEIFNKIYALMFAFENGEVVNHPDIIHEAFIEPWAWHGREIDFINQYEIIGIIPITEGW